MQLHPSILLVPNFPIDRIQDVRFWEQKPMFPSLKAFFMSPNKPTADGYNCQYGSSDDKNPKLPGYREVFCRAITKLEQIHSQNRLFDCLATEFQCGRAANAY